MLDSPVFPVASVLARLSCPGNGRGDGAALLEAQMLLASCKSFLASCEVGRRTIFEAAGV